MTTAMSDREWDATRELVLHAQDDVRRLQDRGQLILGAGLAAAGLSIPIISKAPDVGFALSVLLITFAFAWHMNLNADAAAIAEVRDYLADRANGETVGRPYRYEAIGNAGRGHPATILTGLLPGGVLVGFLVASGLNAFRGIEWESEYLLPDWAAVTIWAVVSVVCVVAFVAAGRSVSDYRQSIRNDLWGPDPTQPKQSLVRLITNMLFRRDDQGWDKDRAKAALPPDGSDS